MKRWMVYALWAILLIGCVMGGFVTRGSFSEVPAKEEDLAPLQYFYRTKNQTSQMYSTEFSATVAELVGQADCVVVATFRGDRRGANKAYKSWVFVEQVLYGGEGLIGKEILIYEPVTYKEYNGELYRFANPDVWEVLQAQFSVEDEGSFYLSPTAGYDFGGTMLQPGQSYILFLQERPRAMGMDKPEVPEYVFIESPYCKVWTDRSVPLEQYVQPPLYLTAGQAADYEILVDNQEIYRQFVDTKTKIFLTFHISVE